METPPRSAVPVNDNIRQYLKEISDAIENENIDRQQLVTSAIEEIAGIETAVATDVECSRFLEKIISCAAPSQTIDILQPLATRDMLYAVACNPFGSHVLEKLLLQLQDAFGRESLEDARQMIGCLVKLVKEDVGDYITHKYGTFFARRLLQLLTGQLNPQAISSPDSRGKHQDIAKKVQSLQGRAHSILRSSTARKADAHEQCDGRLQEHVDAFVEIFTGAVFDENDVFNLQRSTYGSPFLQALISVPLDMPQRERLVCQMLGVAPSVGETMQSSLGRLDATSIISQMKHRTASHTMEAVFMNCPASIYGAVWSCLEPKFESLCLNPISNFAAQSLIASAPSARYIGDIFHKVKGSLGDIITRGRSGVACVLATACSTWNVECVACCGAVEAVFPDGVIPGLALLGQQGPLEFGETASSGNRPPRLSVNGCIILQALLAMPQTACGRITDAVVALPASQLGHLAVDPSGARILEVLLKGSAPKSLKHKMLLALQHHYNKMAKLGAASRLVEACFTWAGISEKEMIVQSLVGSIADLKDSKYGDPICEMCMLELYKNSADTWRRKMSASDKMNAQYEKLFDTKHNTSKKRPKAKRQEMSAQDSMFANQTQAQDRNADERGLGKANMPGESNASSVTRKVMETLGIGIDGHNKKFKRMKPEVGAQDSGNPKKKQRKRHKIAEIK